MGRLLMKHEASSWSMREVEHGKGFGQLVPFQNQSGLRGKICSQETSHDTCNVTMEPRGGKRHMSPVTCHSPVDTLECPGSTGSLN